MKSKKKLSFILLIIITSATVSSFIHFHKKRQPQISITPKERIEADSFIQSHLLLNIARKETPPKYCDLSDKEVHYFLQLQRGATLIKRNKIETAWEVWNQCLNNAISAKYRAETYFIIGKNLWERDANSSLILLQKALEISRSPADENKLMAYCCLNSLVNLLVTQAEYDIIGQDIDKLVLKYSTEADKMRSDKSLDFREQNLSTSIYRVATESLLWLGEDSLANHFIEQLTAHKNDFTHPTLTEGYIGILQGIKTYIDEDYDLAEKHFLNAIDEIGQKTTYLNYDLELPYAYLSAMYIDQKKYAKAIACMEKSIKALQNEYYNDIDEPLKKVSPKTMKGQQYTYNIILCYLRLQYFYKEAINHAPTSFNREQLMNLIAYTNHMIKQWFLNAADEETLLWATKLMKRSNANGVDITYTCRGNLANAADEIFLLQTEAYSFYLNHLIALKKTGPTSSIKQSQFEKISALSLSLMKAELDSLELHDTFIQKRLMLLQLKSELWHNNPHNWDNVIFQQEIPKKLCDDEAVIKFFASYRYLYATYYTNARKGVMKVPLPKVMDKLNRLQYNVKSGMPFCQEQRFFYDLLFKPLENVLKGVTHLTILPDEMLASVPFELLVNAKGEHLIENFAVTYAYSNNQASNETRPPINSFLAVAPGFEKPSIPGETTHIKENWQRESRTENKEKATKLSPLTYSIDEARSIAQLFDEHNIQHQVLLARHASKQNLISSLREKSIVHIATHGISKNNKETGLFFTQNTNGDGFLSLKDLYHIDMQVNLVVLSACKTGVGTVEEGEGVMALPRGFIYAGVPNVVASLWQVHDQKTKELMVAFYTHLLKEDVSYARALQLAKRDCINKGLLPLDWAAFILISH